MTTAYRRADGHPVVVLPASADRFTRLHWRLRNRLPMWVIYDTTTREYPGSFVARMWVSLPAPKFSRFVIVRDTLDDLRYALPDGLICIGRKKLDAPEIVEVWI